MSLNDIRAKILYDYLGRVPRNRPFVFGIGLSKTGTTSLNDALNILGYRAFHLPPTVRMEAGIPRLDIPWWVFKFNALTDITISVFHDELQAWFPRSRLIYTRRDMDSWLESCRRHFIPELAEARVEQGHVYINELCTALYGSAVFDEALYRDAYARFEERVLSLHRDKDTFLDYDLIGGAGWEPLCEFLSKPVPDRPFPVSNKGRQTSGNRPEIDP